MIDQVDQYDESCNAALKGIRAEPQQPELPKLQQALAAADKVVMLAESQDVSRGGEGLDRGRAAVQNATVMCTFLCCSRHSQ